MTLTSFFSWLETTDLARAIAESLVATASLSALHVIGFTLITGSALVANLRLLGVFLDQRPILEVSAPANRAIAVGLAVSFATGLLLVSAAVFHFTVHRNVTQRASAKAPLLQATGVVGLALWLGVAAAGCAFILLE